MSKFQYETDLYEPVRDYLTADTSEIWVDSSEAYARVRDYLTANAPRLTKSCHNYEGAEPLFQKFAFRIMGLNRLKD